MKTVDFGDEMPIALKSMNAAYGRLKADLVSDLRRQARKNLKFTNYMPTDETLGVKGDETLTVGDKVDKETSLRVDKMIRAFYSDTREATKIIPKKSTLDLETKLKSRFERLKLRTEMGIVSILKEKVQKEKAEQTNSFEPEEEMNGKMNGIMQNGLFEEAAMLAQERRLQAIEENLKIKEVLTFGYLG